MKFSASCLVHFEVSCLICRFWFVFWWYLPCPSLCIVSSLSIQFTSCMVSVLSIWSLVPMLFFLSIPSIALIWFCLSFIRSLSYVSPIYIFLPISRSLWFAGNHYAPASNAAKNRGIRTYSSKCLAAPTKLIPQSERYFPNARKTFSQFENREKTNPIGKHGRKQKANSKPESAIVHNVLHALQLFIFFAFTWYFLYFFGFSAFFCHFLHLFVFLRIDLAFFVAFILHLFSNLLWIFLSLYGFPSIFPPLPITSFCIFSVVFFVVLCFFFVLGIFVSVVFFFGAILKTQLCKNLPAIIRNVASSMRVKHVNAKHGVDTMQAQNPDSIMAQFPFPLEVRTAKCCKYRANERSKLQDVANSPTPKTVEKTQFILNKAVQKQTGQTIAQNWDGPTAFWNTSSKLHLKEQKTHISRSNSAQHMKRSFRKKNMHPRVGKHSKQNDFCKWQNLRSSQDTIARPCKNTCRTLM